MDRETPNRLRRILMGTAMGAVGLCLAVGLIAFTVLGILQYREELEHLEVLLHHAARSPRAGSLVDEPTSAPVEDAESMARSLSLECTHDHSNTELQYLVGVPEGGTITTFVMRSSGESAPERLQSTPGRENAMARVLRGERVLGLVRDPGGGIMVAAGGRSDRGHGVVVQIPLSHVILPYARNATLLTLVSLVVGVLAHRLLRHHLRELLVTLEARETELRSEVRERAEAQAKVEEILKAAPDTLIEVDGACRIRHANPRLPELLGWSPEEVDGEELSLLLQGAGAGLQAMLRVATRQTMPEAGGAPFRAIHKNGSLVPVDVTIRLLGEKAEAGAILSIRDFTHEVRARAEAFEFRRRVQQLLDGTHVGVVGAAADGSCTFANRAAAAILGHPTALSLRGRAVEELLTGRRPAAAVEFPATGGVDLHRAHVNDAMFLRSDGRPFPAEYWSTRVADASDAEGFVLTFLDISDRREAEENLNLRDQMHRLIAHVSATLVVADEKGLNRAIDDTLEQVGRFLACRRIVLMLENAPGEPGATCVEWRAGAEAGEGTGGVAVPRVCVREEDVVGGLDGADLTAAVRTGDRAIGMLLVMGPDRDHLPRQTLLELLKIVAETLAEAIGRERATRELATSQARLQQAQRLEAIGSLAAGVAHEINTPMQYIGDNLHFLDRALDRLMGFARGVRGLSADASTPAPVREALSGLETEAKVSTLETRIPRALDSAREGVAAVSRIVQAMKGFAHRGTGTFDPADLNQALTNTATVCRNEWKYVADLDLALDPGLPLVPCRVDELNQVFLNLIVNAAHAIADRPGRAEGEKGKITVTSSAADGAVVVRVSDTGCGIPESIRARIFEPFFTTKEVGRGSGQGLAIARSVVEGTHQGRLCFETEPGLGTTFIVQIPLERAEQAREAA